MTALVQGVHHICTTLGLEVHNFTLRVHCLFSRILPDPVVRMIRGVRIGQSREHRSSQLVGLRWGSDAFSWWPPFGGLLASYRKQLLFY